MKIPLGQVKKALRHPLVTSSYIAEHPQAIAEEVLTPIRAQYLFDRTEDWDLAIILDACRYDLGVEAAREREWLPEPECVWSAGAHSQEWMRRTFEAAFESQLRETTYVSANQFTETVLPDFCLQDCDEVWRYAWDGNLECVPPRPVTDRTISAIRNGRGDRFIAHYMQPHLPPVTNDSTLGEIEGLDPKKGWSEGNPWRRVEKGELDPEIVEQAYRRNIAKVLDEVKLLINNAEASDVVVTSDHGNYLGERGKWGHEHTNQISNAVRSVPWWELSASDEETHHPSDYNRSNQSDSKDLLNSLGYL